MSDLLQDYIDEFKEFLPKTYKSSPISKSVKVKVLEVMVKRLSFSASLYDSEKLRLRILANEPFELGLLPEVIATLKRNFTYYKWERVGSAYELTLYKERPKDYTRYLLQTSVFVVGYLLMILLAFVTAYCNVYFIFVSQLWTGVDSTPSSPREVVLISFMFVFLICTLINHEFYTCWFKTSYLGEKFTEVLYFGSLDSIDRPKVL